MVFERTKIPIERQNFFLGEKKIQKKIKYKKIVINKAFKDIIYIKYPNSKIEKITTDLFNTGIE